MNNQIEINTPIGLFKLISDVPLKYRLINNNEEEIASFNLSKFPNNSGIIIFTNVFVKKEYRGMGIGSILHSYKLKLVKDLGYSIAMCTTLSTNIPEIKILIKNNWLLIKEFKNKRTGNNNLLWIKNLD